VSLTVAEQVVVAPALRVLGVHDGLTPVFRLMMLSVAVTTVALVLGLKFGPPL
jgi:hypothetical protein